MVTVQLLVYDISRGMAAQMSEAFLGQHIPGVWHTGVVVFNMEYFFGGGIQCLPIGAFSRNNNLQAVSILDMGNTTHTQAELEQFLREASQRFSQSKYDLINNNCNHFSDAVVTFLCGHSIPSYIIDLPRIALASPNGALLRNLLEGFENNMQPMDPFSNAGASSLPISTLSSTSNNTPSIVSNARRISIDLETKPIISADREVKAVQNMLRKVAALTRDGRRALSELQLLTLLKAINSAASGTCVAQEDLSAFDCMHDLIGNVPESQVPILFCLRLLVLQEENFSSSSSLPISRLISLIVHMIMDKPEIPHGAFSSVPAMSLAITVLVNTASHESGIRILTSSESSALDAGMRAQAHDRPEVNSMGASFIYNLCLAAEPSQELSPLAVQVICGTLETLFGGEATGRPVSRMLRTICLLLRTYASAAATLVGELGFGESLQIMREHSGLIRSPADVDCLDEVLMHLRDHCGL